MRPVNLTIPPEQLKRILDETAPGWPLFPELDEAKKDPAALRETPTAQMLLQAAKNLVVNLYPLPQTTYTLYREFRHTGERRGYQGPYFQKRVNLTAATLALFFGRDDLLDAVQDYLWDICEETNWVIPAHESRSIDLFSAETGFQLAETLALLEGKLHKEIVERIKAEIEQRIFQLYLAHHDEYGWYKGHSNWNGVCNSSVGNTFLILERDSERLAQALSLVLGGLETFLNTAFEEDGGSTEGVGYWQYGLMNMICFSEMLRQRTQGRVDILSVTRMRSIALYPLKVMLSAGHFANFSDSEEQSSFHPGIVTRLAERTGRPATKNLLAGSGAQTGFPMRVAMALRTMLWWDGTRPEQATVADAHLPNAGVVRLVAQTKDQTPVVVAFKAGNNAENHNQNDVGSFVVHVGGETFLCEPGRGLYSRQYFSAVRYENVFANSYGHSVPVVDETLQAPGREFAGRVLTFAPDEEPKHIVAEIGGAYPVPHLESAQRAIHLAATGVDAGTITLTDRFVFSKEPAHLQEAFVTWLEVNVQGSTALLHGKEYDLGLTIEAPAGAMFSLELLEEASRANAKSDVLKRLSVDLPPQHDVQFTVRMDVTTRKE